MLFIHIYIYIYIYVHIEKYYINIYIYIYIYICSLYETWAGKNPGFGRHPRAGGGGGEASEAATDTRADSSTLGFRGLGFIGLGVQGFRV